MRIGNLESRIAKHYGKETDFIEFIKWYPNNYYKKQDDFIYDESRGLYQDKKYPNHYVSGSCFNFPESCFVVAEFNISEEEPNVISICDRVFELTDEELLTLKRLVKEAYDQQYRE